MRNRAHRRLAAGLAAVAALAAAPAAAAAPDMAADPPLSPAFDPAVRDYVSRCEKNEPLRISGVAARRGTVSVDGRRPRSGAFSASVALDDGQQVTIRSRERDKTTAYHVRCLPNGFPTWTTRHTGRTQAGHYILTPVGDGLSRWIAIVDPNGVPLWWMEGNPLGIDGKLLPNGHVAWTRYHADETFGSKRSQAYEEFTLGGRRVRVTKAVGSPTDIHDLQVLPNGHRLVITFKRRDGVDLRSQGGPENATVLDGEVQEINRRGRRVWSWNSKDHIALDERRVAGPLAEPSTLPGGVKAYNLVHLNSIEPHGDRLLISMRLPSAVYDIDRRTGRILWKLGGTETPESLRVIGDSQPAPYFGGQHDARLLRDGTVTIYDNGTGRGRPPRAVRYRIDPEARTATLVEEITDPDVTRSNFAGSARRMAGGNWVVSWGGTPLVEELTPAGSPVFSLRLADTFFSYRAFPIARGRLGSARLRRAMNAMHPRR